MPGSRPQTLALAAVVSHFVAELCVSQRRQSIRRNELPLARGEAFCIACKSIVPLRRNSARLVDACREHALHIRARRDQRLPQVNFLALPGSECHQLLVLADEHARNPARLPVASFNQLFLGGVLCHLRGLLRFVLDLLHRARAFILGADFRRIGQLLRRCLSGWLRRWVLRCLAARTPGGGSNERARQHGSARDQDLAPFVICRFSHFPQHSLGEPSTQWLPRSRSGPALAQMLDAQGFMTFALRPLPNCIRCHRFTTALPAKASRLIRQPSPASVAGLFSWKPSEEES